ncbi:MAG: hypothetical protein GTO67_11430 [Gammaproteobacteria bacterium]|nr:hypothetical protein [Gammaproteobacteria bacterium]NIM74784.1 hypothetical protein [Gammaproteobacteria bacterium]NIN39215.1 hypothetical protein [Gammaproteobacteria bacterium]NIO26701.1 hypothetical protein [Gammaproteobacteria bacterium]NIO67257.1 hypothetical protein [Gammaproteobacteria bacterium]
MTLALAACAARPPAGEAVFDAVNARVEACRDLYRSVDARTEAAGVADGQSARIDGFPYLRIERFFAADAVKPAADGDDFEAWVRHLQALDRRARHFELQNLPADLRSELGADVAGRLSACADVLIDAVLDSPDDRKVLLENARVLDDYSIAKRVFGLYPFTSVPFISGVEAYQKSTREEFDRSLDALAVAGRLVRYVPPPAPAPAPIAAPALEAKLRGAQREPLGMPSLSALERERLLETFAPVYEIDVVDDNDRIGAPFWADDGNPSVDVRRPVVFGRVAHTRFEGRTLVQLVYSAWFPSRPAEGDFDMLSGRLDGITLRITLAADGRPLMYDSMHNCGCYHMFVPTTRLRERPPSGRYEEPPLVPQRVSPGPGRVVLRLAHRTHYLQRLYFDDQVSAGQAYSIADDDSLRSLPKAHGQRRSLFEPDGLVRGTERGERWFFWPMGIAEPGAMRQWGRHATLFVGLRHFDDADLIERYFVSTGND